MINTLLVSSGLVHPGPFARWQLRKLLGKCTAGTIAHRPTLEHVTAEDYAWAHLVVLYFHRKQVSEDAFTRFSHYLEDTGSVLAIHAPTASFKQFAPWFDMLGGRFTDHGPVQTITVTHSSHTSLLKDIPAFSITEELYHHEMHATVDVHLTATEGQVQYPVVWTKTQGNGHLAYMGFGHRGKVFTNPYVAEITATLINWLTERDNAA